MPASVAVSPDEKLLFTANHAFFDHVVKVVETAEGKWVEKFEYDDPRQSSMALPRTAPSATYKTSSYSPGMASTPGQSHRRAEVSAGQSHAHIVVVDPSESSGGVREGRGSASTSFGSGADWSSPLVYQCPLGTVPGTLPLTRNTGRMFMTCEFSSELWSFDFDTSTGCSSSSTSSRPLSGFTGRNEPATVQVHPNGRFVYMNNRGEDTIVCFSISADGPSQEGGIGSAASLTILQGRHAA